MKRLGWFVGVAAVLTLAVTPRLWADLAPPERPALTPEQRLEKQRQRLERRAATFASALASASASPAPSGSAGPAFAIREQLAQKLAELKATRAERRERHRSALVRQFGARLNVPEIKAELELHARREAELARVAFLARNARSGDAREKLLARAAKLAEREQARHAARMERLQAAAGAPSAGLSAQPAPSAPPAASAQAPR